ncbi:4'-phosphopantetheinyl transferase superfamily [Infundibulicybe gibba]|nr:4'-phosphopantetheinyl transferase superfamily [Infundibulicybe gibba]
MLGIGVDVVHIPRVVALCGRRTATKLAARILSTHEHQQWSMLRQSDSIRFLAVRWAVKEAAYKAVYPTARPTWKELTYNGLAGEGTKPSLVYETGDVGRIHVSVSHDGDYVFASVLVEG